MNSSSAWFTRHRPRSSSVTAGMNAVPATALGEAGSWNRSSQPDSADGEGVARSRSRRQRLFSDRRSARESKSFSIAAQDRRKAAVALQPFDVFDAVAAGEVQENHRQNHLDVEPALAAGRPHMPPDRRAEPAGLDQVEIQRKTGQRGQSMAGRISLVLEIEKPCASIAHPVGDGS